MAASTSQRRSFGRQRPTLKLSSFSTASSPNLSSAFASSQEPPPLPSLQLSTQRPRAGVNTKTSHPLKADHDNRSFAPNVGEQHQTQELGSSPLTMYPSRPANSRTVTDDKNANQNLEVGDLVDVPGSMHGTIKFIGEVKGKKGHFAGVELSKEFASKGKNDGDVDGIRYFTTSVRGAGIFLPSSKAYKRISPSFSSDSMPPTPDTPNLGSSYLGSRKKESKVYTPTSSTNPKFSQSIGPGRVRSPELKSKSRPSLPRPESPIRRGQNAISTPSSRPSIGGPKLSKSVVGGGRYAPSPTPARFGASVHPGATGDPGRKTVNVNKPTPKTPESNRPQSRSNSRLGPEAMFDEESDNTPVNVSKIQPVHSAQQKLKPDLDQDMEIRKLRQLLEMRDKQLDKQTSDLEEMQNSIAELQTATPKHDSAGTLRSRGSGIDELDAPALRALVREKNEKITALGSDFDAHRAQFRSTIDSLERTSDETNRIYEAKVQDLNLEIRDLQDRGEDVESVAQQLKQLEELVQELEEGLEDARRGEAEARGEVEYLRGEVERTQSEIQREREKAAAALKEAGRGMDGTFSPGGSSKEIEQRDDEIRGLKAIIHSLSRDAVPEIGSPRSGSRRISKRNSNQANGHLDNQIIEERQAREKLETEIKHLEGLVDRKTYREEELEHEIERLRLVNAHVGTNGHSENGPTANGNRRPDLSKGSSYDWRDQRPPANKQISQFNSTPESDSHSVDSSSLYCEMCETFGHELLSCPNINGKHSQQHAEQHGFSGQPGTDEAHENSGGLAASTQDPNIYPPPLSPSKSPGRSLLATPGAKLPNPMDQGPVAGKDSGIIEVEKWCAICEKDGHPSVDCPFEDVL